MKILLLAWALLTSCLAQDTQSDGLRDWLRDPLNTFLYSEDLDAFVPVPYEPEGLNAYDRFSVINGISRIMRGTAPFVQSRPAKIDEAEVEALTDDKYKLGLVYFWSLGGVKRDLRKAFEYFEQAAAEGDGPAMFMVGVAYATGFLGQVPQDQAKATLYYTLSAEQSTLEALVAMGYRKELGIHTPVDKDGALRYYSTVGDFMYDLLEDHHENDQWFYQQTPWNTFSFGAELNTGLYGKHVYRQHIDKHVDTTIPLGKSTSAWAFVRHQYGRDFEDLSDAVDTLYYRATEEFDSVSMYTLARIYALGTDSSGPNWRLANSYARKCYQQDAFVSKRLGQIPPHEKMQAWCAVFLAERYLHGNEGVAQDINEARRLYKWASRVGHDECKPCLSGLALCDYAEAMNNGTINELVQTISSNGTKDVGNSTGAKVLTNLQRAYVRGVPDYTLSMVLAKFHIMAGEYNIAKEILRAIIFGNRTPEASLLLAPYEASERQLARYSEGLAGTVTTYTPLDFAHASYDRGDIESAMLAFMVSAEMGVTSAALNLADLLDVRHSMLGAKHADRFPLLRALTEWPVPAFVENRIEHAAYYFSHAAAQGSADGLAKLFDYGHHYGLVPAHLNQWYLEALSKTNMGMSHWTMGTLEYSQKKYQQAMDRFRRALVSPEAWLPVKFSQFLGSYHLLKDEANTGRSLWSRLKEAYQVMATFEPNFDPDLINPFSNDTVAAGLQQRPWPSADTSGAGGRLDKATSKSWLKTFFSTSTLAVALGVVGVAMARVL